MNDSGRLSVEVHGGDGLTPLWTVTRVGWRRRHLSVFVDGVLVHSEEVSSSRSARRAFLRWRTQNISP